MAFDWNSYLLLAKELKNQTTGQVASVEIEAKQRSAVSRAYYCAYHLAEDFAVTNLRYTPTKKAGGNQFHADVREVYRQQFGNVNHQEIQKILFKMHKARKECDYDATVSNIQSVLTSTIIDADRVHSILTS